MVLEIKASIGGPVGAVSSKKINKKTASSVSSFSMLAEDNREAESVSFLQSGQNLNAVTIEHLVILPETDHNPDSHQKALQHSHDILDLLEVFHNQIICGAVSQKTVKNIEKFLDQTQITYLDPKLRMIIENIYIRAKVELAKIFETFT